MSVTFQRQFTHDEWVQMAEACETARTAAELAFLSEHLGDEPDAINDSDLFFAGSDAVDEISEQFGDVSVNMSNTNARAMLEWLGYDVRNDEDPIWNLDKAPDDVVSPYSGSLDPLDLMSRIQLAIAFVDDPAKPTQSTVTPTGGTFVDCGRPSGYFAEHAKTLARIAQMAHGAGQRVQYA